MTTLDLRRSKRFERERKAGLTQAMARETRMMKTANESSCRT
jgi:hypothetical protein